MAFFGVLKFNYEFWESASPKATSVVGFSRRLSRRKYNWRVLNVNSLLL